MRDKITIHVRNAVHEVFRLKFSSLDRKPSSDSMINAAIEKAAENIRLEVLREVTARLQGHVQSTPKRIVPKLVQKQLNNKNPANPIPIVTSKIVSDDVLKTRILQVINGTKGITVRSLFQRISNHRDIIGTNLKIGRVEVLVNQLLNAQAIKRVSEGSDSKLVPWTWKR